MVFKVRDGAKITKEYDTATTLYAHTDVTALPKRRLGAKPASFNPAAVQRQIHALAVRWLLTELQRKPL